MLYVPLPCVLYRPKTKRETQLTASKIYLLDEHVRQHLINMDFSTLVALPQSVNKNEWLAMHSKQYYE